MTLKSKIAAFSTGVRFPARNIASFFPNRAKVTLIVVTMDFRRDDPIRVIAGAYKGKTGTFIELTGNESGRVKLDNDTVANRTLRMTSLIREDYESDGEERVTMKKSTYDDLVADLEELQQQITDMKYRLKTAVARGNQKPKKKRSKK